MKRAAALGLILCAMAAPTSALHAQYREGTPEVLRPPPPAPNMRGALEAKSADDYRRAGSPRIVVFWNRELGDRIANDYDGVIMERGEATAGAGYATVDREVRVGRREVENDRRDSLMPEDAEWEFLEGFQSRLQSNGIVLVDRALAMRALAAADGAPGDKQTVEMRGIAKLADLMMTVTQTEAPDAPLGIRFKVTVTNLKDGRMITTLVADGNGPPRGPGRFVAGANGFEREQAPGVGPGRAGANLASDLLVRLAGKWR
jgi:hypothetical protein